MKLSNADLFLFLIINRRIAMIITINIIVPAKAITPIAHPGINLFSWSVVDIGVGVGLGVGVGYGTGFGVGVGIGVGVGFGVGVGLGFGVGVGVGAGVWYVFIAKYP